MGGGGTGARSRSPMRVEHCFLEDELCHWEDEDFELAEDFGAHRRRRNRQAEAFLGRRLRRV